MRRAQAATAAFAALITAAMAFGAAPAGARSARHARAADVTATPLSGAVAVSPVGVKSSLDEPLALVAGSAQYLVFSRSSDASNVDPNLSAASLYVTNSSGDVTPLGTQPAGAGWSIAGNMLTSEQVNGSTSNTVDWVNLADGTSGSGSIPDGASYLGATAAGWAYVNDNELFTETTTGTSTSLGFPLGNAAGENVTSGGTGPNGALVVDATSAVAYVPYADPTHPVTLSTTNLAAGYPSPVFMRCLARTTDAFCALSHEPTDSNGVGERLSLTGGAPTAVPALPQGLIEDFAIDDQSTAVSDGDSVGVSQPDGSGNVLSLDNDETLTSAFNKIAITNSTNTAIDTFAAPGDTPTELVAPNPAPVQASEPGITSGRVAYLDDQVSPTTKPAQYVWARPVRNVNGHIRLGAAGFLGKFADSDDLVDDFDSAIPTLSSATVAVSLDNGSEEPPTAILRPVHPTSVPATFEGVALETLSGNRVMNRDAAGVRDTVTGRFIRLAKRQPIASAMWGQRYCSMAHSGAITCKNIDTRASTKVRGPVFAGSEGTTIGDMWLYGDHLSWCDTNCDQAGKLVDLRHPRRRIGLGSMSVVSLTSNGVLLMKNNPSRTQTTYYLRGYGAHATPVEVLDSTGFDPERHVDVSIDQSVMTWPDDSVIMAAPLPHVADPPRFLGAPIAPRHLTIGKTKVWWAYLPYSASLDRCTVTIRRGHHTLRTLRCASTSMQYGGAVAAWDGRDAHGNKVAAGKVTWTAHVSNHDGQGLAASGSKKPVTGTITVKH